MKNIMNILMNLVFVALLWVDDAEEIRSVGWKDTTGW